MKRIKTLHVPIWKDGNVVHVATITSDWTDGDYKSFAEMFRNCGIRTASGMRCVNFIGQAYHCMTFKHMARWQMIGEPCKALEVKV